MKMSSNHHGGQGGFTYLWVLLMLTMLSVALLQDNSHRQAIYRQQQEEELFFRGMQIRNAIQQFQKAGKGCFPASFDDLLRDPRGKTVVYHLRRWFTDPLTGSRQWGMSYDDKGRWIGVYSKGKGTPLRTALFPKDFSDFQKAKSYKDWAFKVEEVPSAPLPAACTPVDGHTVYAHSDYSHLEYGHAAHGQSTTGQSSGGPSADGQSPDGQSPDGQSADEQSPNEQPSGDRPAAQEATD